MMSQGFPQRDVEALLVACHRRCCVCHRFCGVKIEIDHIVPKGEKGPSTIENGIAVCFECHAEIHSYNDKHPRGRKFQPNELRQHKEQWLRICKERPDVLVLPTRAYDVGPLQALIDELEFNLHVAGYPMPADLGCLFLDEQLQRAMQSGAISILDDDLRSLILEAYRATRRANQVIPVAVAVPSLSTTKSWEMAGARDLIAETRSKIEVAHGRLLGFLKSED